jgi:putative redox protein
MANEIKAFLRQISPSTSEAKVGNHQVLIDRPASKGDTDLGPMGGELFLTAIGGCFMSNLLAAIKTKNADVSDVRVEVTGRLVGSPARFVAVDICVTAENGIRELLEHLVSIADRGCIMKNTLRDKPDAKIRIGAARPLVEG